MDIINPEKYYEQVQKRFPFLNISQINNIVKHGLRTFFGYNVAGGDVLIKTQYFTAYSGKLFLHDDIFWKYVLIKKKIKARIKYRRTHKKFDGKYYFGMTKRYYNEVYKPVMPSGRKRKCWTPDNLTIFKSYEECCLFAYDYIFELSRRYDVGFISKISGEKLRRYHLIAKRDKDGKIKPVDTEHETKHN